jgi:uncharacterized protein (DUF1778 family)
MTDADLTRLTVHLNQKARSALAYAAAMTGDTSTDTVNRALIVFALLTEAESSVVRRRTITIDGVTWVRRPKHGWRR